MKAARNKGRKKSAATATADSVGNGLVSLKIYLPDRATLEDEAADIRSAMNAYRMDLWSAGDGCAYPSEIREVGRFNDLGWVLTNVRQGCDYKLNFELGHMENLTLALAGDSVSYEQDIRPILEKSCTGCHSKSGSRPSSDLSTWTGVSQFKQEIVKRVSTGSMPPGGALDQTLVDLFNEWETLGFLEAASASDQTDAGQGQTTPIDEGRHPLAQVFYQNNEPELVKNDLIRGKTAVVLNFDLTLQDDGKAIGLSTATIRLQEPAGAAKSPPTSVVPAGTNGSGAVSSNAVSYGSSIKSVLDKACVSCHPDMSTYQGVVNQGAAVVTRIVDGSMPPSGALPQAQVDLIKKWQATGFPEI